MRWLLDEMLPPDAAATLNELGHDAVSVAAAGLAGEPDAEVFSYAVSNNRLIVTENVADYAALVTDRLSAEKPCVPIIFVSKSAFPRGGLAVKLAKRLATWADGNPRPYEGLHWL